jgi:arginine exporter protein ArgO
VSTALLAGLLAGYGIAVPVGAVGTYLVSLTARTSLRTGACAALGIATADGLYALLATVGGTVLAAALRPVLGPLRWASALVLLALAVRGAVTALRRHRAGPPDGPAAPPAPGAARAYLGLLGITLLNPATVVYFAALVLGSRSAQAVHPSAQGVFVLAAFAASASWQLLLAGGGALLGRALTGRRGRLVTALVSSTVIALLAVRMLVP